MLMKCDDGDDKVMISDNGFVCVCVCVCVRACVRACTRMDMICDAEESRDLK